jgi:putative transposase
MAVWGFAGHMLRKEQPMSSTLSHTVWECKYHIVWVPKNRRKVIFGKLRREIGVIIRRLCEYKGVKILEAKACIDHIHLCVEIAPKYSVATIVGYLKGKSAIIVFEKYSRLKKNFKGHSFWARGYYVSTVGLDEAKVRKYIQDQELSDSVEDRYDSNLSNPF